MRQLTFNFKTCKIYSYEHLNIVERDLVCLVLLAKATEDKIAICNVLTKKSRCHY